jgi:hypothetical protein
LGQAVGQRRDHDRHARFALVPLDGEALGVVELDHAAPVNGTLVEHEARFCAWSAASGLRSMTRAESAD